MELSWTRSELWKHLITQINKNRTNKIRPIIENSRPKPIMSFSTDEDVTGGNLYMVLDSARRNKTGDMQLHDSFKTSMGQKVKIFIECKFSSTKKYVEKGIDAFFSLCSNRSIISSTVEIYIFLSYEEIDVSVIFLFVFVCSFYSHSKNNYSGGNHQPTLERVKKW